MVQQAATVQSVKVKIVRRRLARALISIVSLCVIDICLSALSFLLSYKIRQDAPIFIWSRLQSAPIGIASAFEPYFSMLLFVPFVKVFALQRYGFYKLRGEFSFSSDLFRIVKATTVSFMILVLVAFLFR